MRKAAAEAEKRRKDAELAAAGDDLSVGPRHDDKARQPPPPPPAWRAAPPNVSTTGSQTRPMPAKRDFAAQTRDATDGIDHAPSAAVSTNSATIIGFFVCRKCREDQQRGNIALAKHSGAVMPPQLQQVPAANAPARMADAALGHLWTPNPTIALSSGPHASSGGAGPASGRGSKPLHKSPPPPLHTQQPRVLAPSEALHAALQAQSIAVPWQQKNVFARGRESAAKNEEDGNGGAGDPKADDDASELNRSSNNVLLPSSRQPPPRPLPDATTTSAATAVSSTLVAVPPPRQMWPFHEPRPSQHHQLHPVTGGTEASHRPSGGVPDPTPAAPHTSRPSKAFPHEQKSPAGGGGVTSVSTTLLTGATMQLLAQRPPVAVAPAERSTYLHRRSQH